MSGVMQWLQQQQGDGAPAPGAPQPPGPAQQPSHLAALQQAWQHYRSPQGATPPLVPQQGKPPLQMPKQPARPPSFTSLLHPSSIRVDFHRPPEPQE